MQCKRKTHALARRFGYLGPESDSNPDPVSAFSASLAHALFPVERRGYGGLPDIVLRRSVHRAGNGNCERDKPPRRHRRRRRLRVGPNHDLVAAVHPHLHDRPHGLHPKKARYGHQDVGHQGRPFRCKRRHHSVRRADHGSCRHDRHRQHRRRGHGPSVRRPGRHLLDVDYGHLGHCHQVLRGLHRREVPREGPLRQDARRRDVCA